MTGDGGQRNTKEKIVSADVGGKADNVVCEDKAKSTAKSVSEAQDQMFRGQGPSEQQDDSAHNSKCTVHFIRLMRPRLRCVASSCNKTPRLDSLLTLLRGQ